MSDNRKMITNQQLELYNKAAVEVLKPGLAGGGSGVKLLAATRQAAMATIAQSDDGLHLPESTRSVVGEMIPDVSFRIVAPWSPRQQRFCLSPPSPGSHGAHELRVQ